MSIKLGSGAFLALRRAPRISGGTGPRPVLGVQSVAHLEVGRRPGTGATRGAPPVAVRTFSAGLAAHVVIPPSCSLQESIPLGQREPAPASVKQAQVKFELQGDGGVWQTGPEQDDVWHRFPTEHWTVRVIGGSRSPGLSLQVKVRPPVVPPVVPPEVDVVPLVLVVAVAVVAVPPLLVVEPPDEVDVEVAVAAPDEVELDDVVVELPEVPPDVLLDVLPLDPQAARAHSNPIKLLVFVM